MSKFDDVSIGTVTSIEKFIAPKLGAYNPSRGGNVYLPDLQSEHTEWRIEGFMVDPAQDLQDKLRSLTHRTIVLIDVSDEFTALIGYGKIKSMRLMVNEQAGNVLDWEVIVQMLSSLGTTRINSPSSDVYLMDYEFMQRLETLDPLMHDCNPTWHSTRLRLSYEFYVANYKNSSQDIVLEAEVGDDISYIEVWGWKSSAWDLIGRWGTGYTAWGTAGSTWTDEDSDQHIPTADKDVRGAVKTIGTITTTLGCNTRVLLKLTGFNAGNVTHYTTKYGEYQLLLKINLVHVVREVAKAYPVITYITGGMELGVP